MTTSMTMNDIINLNYELSGIVSQDKSSPSILFKGVLSQPISFKTKVYLLRLKKWVDNEMSVYNEANKELFEKLGVEKDGFYSIPEENMESFNAERSGLLSASKDIDVPSVCGANLSEDMFAGIVADECYEQITKLITY